MNEIESSFLLRKAESERLEPPEDAEPHICARCGCYIYPESIEPGRSDGTYCEDCTNKAKVEESEREQWLRNRKKGIGASDAAAAVGLSPYKTNVELWEEKTGRRQAKDISADAHVQYGKQAEKYIRGLFTLDYPQYQVDYDEFGMIANNQDFPFAFATLDGDLTEISTGRKGILEIKTVEILRSGQWDEWTDKIPQHYYCQCLHQLLATGYDFVILRAHIRYTDRKGSRCATIRDYPIERKDAESDINWLAPREKVLWECVEQDKRPALIMPEI